MREAMKTIYCVLALALLMTLSLARAEDAAAPKSSGDTPSETQTCQVPDEMLATESVLAKVADKLKSSHQLDVVVVGSGSSTLTGPGGAAAAYPARLEAFLGQKLPGVTVHVTTDLHQRQPAADVAGGLAKLVNDRKPALVVWQTGTVDALKSIDHEVFRAAITNGTKALKSAGADVILMNAQYNPRIEAVLSMSSYLDDIRVAAQEQDVPLFDRFAMMQHWNDNGDFDLTVQTRSLALARDVHDCVGRVLADFVIQASRVNPEDLRTPK
jgi:hypothetical protein